MWARAEAHARRQSGGDSALECQADARIRTGEPFIEKDEEGGTMTGRSNIDTVKTLYEAFGRGDVATILDHLTDDVDWATEAASDAAPWYGRRVGKAAVTGFFEGFASVVDVQEFTPLSFTSNDNEVMTLVRYRGKAKQTGREAAMNLHHYWRFRDGKVEYYRGSEDTVQVAAMLGG
jgi:uncharacterized protein